MLEPRAPRPDLRLAAVRKLSEAGICAGVFPNPVMPLITDSEEDLESLARAAAEAGAKYFGGGALFLMPSAQKVFLPFLEERFPQLAARYREQFEKSPFLGADYKERLRAACRKFARSTGWLPRRSSIGPSCGKMTSSSPFSRFDAAFRIRLPPAPGPDRAGAAGRPRRLAHAGGLSRGTALGGPRISAICRSFSGPGDCLVLNDSRVFPSRLYGHRAGVHSLPIGKKNPARREYLSGEVEVFLLRPVSADGRDWEALVRPGRKMRDGERIRFGDGLEAEIIARGEFGERTIRFLGERDLYAEFEKIGHVPLPPYIKRPDEAADRERYQTVFARERGSVAAPTAGLHFTPEMLDAMPRRRRGDRVRHAARGLGTFQPLHEEHFEGHRLHARRSRSRAENAARIEAARRLVAVGTTSVRTMESAALRGGIAAARGETDLFIYPGFDFRATGAMLTNFHLPRTSLLLLVCAFGGKDLVLAAYRHAVEAGYRFYSYGDCMLLV